MYFPAFVAVNLIHLPGKLGGVLHLYASHDPKANLRH